MIQGFFSAKRIIRALILSLVTLGVGGTITYATPTPSVISYQGFLTSATGTAQTGTTTITIRIYDAATSGTLLYEELHPTTPIANGYFTVQIGNVGDVNGGTTASSITDLTFDRSYYVTVELAAPFATGEMTLAGGTRSQLGTVPFANVAYGALQATSSTGLLTQKGRMYFNTGDNQLYIYDGSSWNPLSVLSSTPTFSTLTVTGTTSLQAASSTALTVSGPTFLNALTLTNASSTGGITATTFYGALIGTTGTFSSTLNVTGKTTLGLASSTALTATNLFSTQASITNASTTNVTTSGNLYLSGLTTGSIPFIGTGGLVSQNNSNFFWDNTNTRLGIGSSSPIATLSVRGAGATNPFVVASSTGTTLLSVSQTGLTTLSTASTTGAATIGGQLFFANASSTGGLTLAQTLNVTGQTTLTNASATALTATTLYGTTAFLGTTTNTFDSSKLVVQGTTTLVGTASSPTALRVMGNIDNTFAQDDWPRLVSSTTTAAPSNLVVSDGFVYVISSAELSIYSVADIRNPLLISTSSIDGNDIKVAGNYAYITGSSFFSVVDIADKRAPVQVSSISYGSSYGYITINGQYAYVSSSVENSLKVIDISNPLEPRVVTSLSVGSSPRDLVVSNTVLYVVDHNNGNLYSFDISDPLNPVLLDTLSVASGLQSVKVSGGYVYVQRFTGGGLYIVDGSSPADLVQIASVGTGSGSNDLKIAGGYAYVPNYNAHTISVVDIRNPYSPTLVKNISTSNNPIALSVDGNNLYVANYGSGEVSFYELPSLESVSALIHSLETGNLSVRNSLTTSGLLSVGTGLTVGSGGFLSRGNSSVYGSLQVGTSTYPNFLVNASNNTTNIGTSTGLASLFIQGTSALDPLSVVSSSGASLFTILTAGNIGIGTTTPIAKLTIQGGNDSIDPLVVASSSGISLFTVLASGNIGISTSTPGSRLDVYDSTSSSDIDIFRVITDVGSAGNVKFRIDSDGDVFTDGGTTIGTPADLAENYPTEEEDITAGMVVSLSTTTTTWTQSLPNGSTTDYEIATVKKATRGEQALGVISTRPGILLGGNTNKGTPVAFSGRVPVYVTNENGVVKKGDSLTISSSTPGYAMKQTTNGQSIGRALSDQSEYSTSSLVMIAVENVNRTISFTDVAGLDLLNASSTLPTLTIRETLRERVLLGYSIVREYVAVTIKGVTGYFDTLFAKDIYTETICIKKSDGTNVCLNGDQVENVLNASNIPLLQNNSTVSGTTTDEEEDVVPEEEGSSSDDNATTTPLTEGGGGGEIESYVAESGPEANTEGAEGEVSAIPPAEAE